MEVVDARWNSEKNNWQVRARSLDEGAEVIHHCKILVAATGVLTLPRLPEIPGQDTYLGPKVHTALWDHSVSLEGKNVAVIGNGCEFKPRPSVDVIY
jgi:cation diffusion facilitator CzcD-associated flavoprotein CzcO